MRFGTLGSIPGSGDTPPGGTGTQVIIAIHNVTGRAGRYPKARLAPRVGRNLPFTSLRQRRKLQHHDPSARGGDGQPLASPATLRHPASLQARDSHGQAGYTMTRAWTISRVRDVRDSFEVRATISRRNLDFQARNLWA
jgi:hypothetical protein